MKKIKLWGIIALVAVIGFAMTACGGGETLYDANGVWDFPVQMQPQNATLTITIIGNNWSFPAIQGTQIVADSGTFNRSGNSGTLYSNSVGGNVGTATLTSNTTMTVVLTAGDLPGTFYGTKQ